ncbi:MAG: hypothetical protein HY690_03965 [Chloroflexi bacterium]|nr:hypothetical protein [Chloroflexota bacterium]
MALLARLNKAGTRVLCGARDCGAELAQVREMGDRTRLLVFGPGWAVRGENGVWALSRHARRRMEQAQRARSPGPLAARYAPSGQPRLRRPVGSTVEDWGRMTGWYVADLPVQAACPTCGSLQWLEAATLRVYSEDWKGEPEEYRPVWWKE